MSDLQCYCCGRPLPDNFALVSMKDESDRVFVMLENHVGHVDQPAVIVKVVRLKLEPATSSEVDEERMKRDLRNIG